MAKPPGSITDVTSVCQKFPGSAPTPSVMRSGWVTPDDADGAFPRSRPCPGPGGMDEPPPDGPEHPTATHKQTAPAKNHEETRRFFGRCCAMRGTFASLGAG